MALGRSMERVPWVGDLWRFFDDRIAFLEGCARAGDVVVKRLGPVRVHVLSHPEHVREVFVREAKHFSRGVTGVPMRAVLGKGLLLSEGETWKRHRTDLQPLFSSEQLAAWTASIERAVDALTSRWQDGEVRDIHQEMHRLTLDVAARLFLGVASDDRGRLHSALEAMLHHHVFQAVIPLGPLAWPLRPSAAQRDLDALVYRQIDSATAPGGSPFVAALAEVSRDRREVRDQLVTLLFTAQDTTAVALTWLWHLLSREARADAIVGEHLAGALSESLRLYPPVVGQARQATSDCEVAGTRVRRGDLVIFSQWVIHRDARWYDDPNSFRPERWDHGLEDRLHPFAFFPFGGGRRVCLGRSLASLMATTVVPRIARRYRLLAVGDGEPALEAVISPRPRAGLPLRLRSN